MPSRDEEEPRGDNASSHRPPTVSDARSSIEEVNRPSAEIDAARQPLRPNAPKTRIFHPPPVIMNTAPFRMGELCWPSLSETDLAFFLSEIVNPD